MNFMNCQNNEVWVVTNLHVSQKDEQRFMSIGIYKGAKIQMVRSGKAKYPSIVYVRGNLWMIRAKDLAKLEGEIR